MKNLLLTLSSISTLTLAGNAALNTNFTEHKSIIKSSTNVTPQVASATPIFNDEYQKLNDSDWITNQATTDHKYYSYDTSHANYELSDKSNARTTFKVDDSGQLVINKKDSYTNIDYNNLNNTKDEIIVHRKVTAFNRITDNAYTGSEFRNDLFSGDNPDWKFLQESQVEKHVDISDVTGANKVSNHDSLSEGLGLYYIGKAAKDQSKEELNTYLALAKAFMNRSVLGTNVPDEVFTGIIITFISSSADVALQYIMSAPYQNSDDNTNYATNYILDSNNQVVEIYYTQYTNQFDIKNLNLQFDPQVISVEKPESKSVKDIESLIKEKVINSFKSQLSDRVKIKPEQLDNKYFNLNFNDSDAIKNFNDTINVSYTITTNWQAANQFNFAGTYDGTIPVINKCVKLSGEDNLKTTIETKYTNTDQAHWLTINIDNKDNSNADGKLTTVGLARANTQINDIIKKDVSAYFQTNDSDIGIKDDDFTISTNLQVGDNLFNQKKGKTFTVTIAAVAGQYRIIESLSDINIIVHGKNTNFINSELASDPAKQVPIDGIKLPDGQDPNLLQDNEHYYQQSNLTKRLIGDSNNKDSVLGTINNNSYSVIDSSFKGHVNIDYKLESGDPKSPTLNIDTASITNDEGSEKNFWDVLTKTTMIWLHTKVETSGNDRKLTTVSLIFATNESYSNPFCVLDISSEFSGISVSPGALITFPDFKYVIDYQQMS
ncbi:hypothetical protein [Spiroplasma endosymbiont of Nebria brevicollis]|uniref:hypothetical protein n=1 Tax=Spiroplasma endosymbiont of Nebria brevicollis TaxID=3066284 RepID=UPI00313B78EC